MARPAVPFRCVLSVGRNVVLEKAAGTQPGHVALNAAGIDFTTSTTLEATFSFGPKGGSVRDSGTLTLAPGSRVDMQGAYCSFGSGTVVNDGTIADTGGASYADIAAAHLINAGTIEVRHGEALNVHGTGWTNVGSVKAASGDLFLDGVTGIVNLGTITLSGRSAFGTGAVAGNPLGSATNDGVITLSGTSKLKVAQPLAGSGTIDIGASCQAALVGGATDQSIAFGGPGATLLLGDPHSFDGLLLGFGAGDAIDLLSTPADGLQYGNGTLTVTEGTAVVARLHVPRSYASDSFQIAPDQNGGTLLTLA